MTPRIRSNIFPFGGYTFTDKDGTIISDKRGWPGVIRAVTAYRKRNKLDVGNAAEEVHAQVCAANPPLCYQQDEITKQELRKVTLKGRVLKWFSDLLRHKQKHGVSFVSDELARAREDVCQKCVQNTALAETCGSCRKAIKEQRNAVLGGRAQYKRLHACGILGVDLQTQVHIDAAPVEEASLPGHCWMRKA